MAVVGGLLAVVASMLVLAGCAQVSTTTLAATPTTAAPGQTVTLTAHVTAATTPAGTVAFRDGTVTIGSAALSGGTATFATTGLAVGTHQLSASFGAQGVWGASVSAPVAVTVQPATARYHLALGDSLAAGTGASAGHGYVADILAYEQGRLPGLQGRNISCGGATTTSMLSGGGCTYAEGTQVAAAVAFLQANPGQVAFITIDIGANDISGCFLGGVIDLTCAQAKTAIVQTNLTTILSRLRAAGGSVPIVGMTYYDPFLAYWVGGNQPAAIQSQQAAASGNALIASVYTAAAAQVADVEAAFDTANFALTGSYNGQVVPQNVANICAWTRMCTNSDIHANDIGHQRIASTFEPLIDAVVPA